MAIKKTLTTITDHMDGQPSIVMPNGNWGVFDPVEEKYVDTGFKASPEDDATAVKYYKLGSEAIAPSAPQIQKGWDSRDALDTALLAAGWSEDPITTTKANRYCWIASYGKTNVTDEQATAEKGLRILKPHFTFTSVRLWSNYAVSPEITVNGGKITITNPDGSTIEQAFVTSESLTDLVNKVEDLQDQVDDAVEAYSMNGVPTMTTKPVTSWLMVDGQEVTDTILKSQIFKAHIGDSYTDLDTFNSYRFTLRKNGSNENPNDYSWEVLAQSDYTQALADIAKLGNEKVSIHLGSEPNIPYFKGDLWITQQGDVTVSKVCIRDSTTSRYVPADWVQPYATKKDLDATNTEVTKVKNDLTQAQTDISSAVTNLEELGGEVTSMNTVITNIQGDLTKEELNNIKDLQDRIDIEQRQARSNMNYLLESVYLSDSHKDALRAIQAKFLKKDTGSVDVLQALITSIIANNNIDEGERSAYNTAFGLYKSHLVEFNDAISDARKAIDLRLEAITDEKVDSIEIGGRNIYSNSTPLSVTRTVVTNRNEGETINGFKITSVDTPDIRHARLSRVINSNGWWTVSFDVRSDDATHVRIDIADIPDTLQGDDREISSEWRRVTCTVDVDRYSEAVYHFVDIGIPPSEANSIEVRNIKIEKGNKATDWTPAPEDVEANIETAKTEAESAAKDYAKTKAEAERVLAEAYADGIVSDEEQARIDDVNDKLAAAKDYAEAQDALLKTQQEAYADGAISTAEQAAIQAAKDYADLKKTEAEAYADGIVSDEEARAIADALEKFNESKAHAETLVNNIEIGGRNLFSQQNYSHHANTYYDARRYTSAVIKVEPNTQYTLHYTVEDTNRFSIYQGDFEEDNILSQIISKGIIEEFINTEIGDKILRTFTTLSSGKYIILYLNNEKRNARETSLKVEKGNKATDWTPAPEDVQAEIDKTNSELAKIADDNLLTPSEKQDVKKEWEQIQGEKNTIIAQAGTYGISTTAYTGKYDALSTYVTPLLADMTADSIIVGDTFRARFKEYYNAKVELQKLITDGSKGYTDDNKPITIDLNRQGSFKTWYKQVDDNGTVLAQPVKVSKVVGGVTVGLVDYVKVTATIYRGNDDVTTTALANGANGKWFVNGGAKAGNGDHILLSADGFADGKDDDVQFEVDITNAKNWNV